MSALKDRYVIPISDFGFKKLFGTEPDKILLTDLISQLISEKHRMKELTCLENELLRFLELKNQRCEVFYDKLKFIYIELPKFRKTEEELETQFDKWLYVFRHLSQLQNRPKVLQDKIFQKLFEAAEIAKFTPKEREIYEDSLKYYRDMKNVVDTAREEGREEGREANTKVV